MLTQTVVTATQTAVTVTHIGVAVTQIAVIVTHMTVTVTQIAVTRTGTNTPSDEYDSYREYRVANTNMYSRIHFFLRGYSFY